MSFIRTVVTPQPHGSGPQGPIYKDNYTGHTETKVADQPSCLTVKLSTSPSHSILTPGQSVPALQGSHGSGPTILRTATLRSKLEIKLSTSSSHSILTPGRPVPATGVPIFKSLVWLDPEKSRRKRASNTGSSTHMADALTTRPARQKLEKLLLSDKIFFFFFFAFPSYISGVHHFWVRCLRM